MPRLAAVRRRRADRPRVRSFLGLALLVLLGSATASGAVTLLIEIRREAPPDTRATSLDCTICTTASPRDHDEDLVQELRQSILRQFTSGTESGAAAETARYRAFARLHPMVRFVLLTFWGIPLLVPGTGITVYLITGRREDVDETDDFPHRTRGDGTRDWNGELRRSRLSRLLNQ